MIEHVVPHNNSFSCKICYTYQIQGNPRAVIFDKFCKDEWWDVESEEDLNEIDSANLHPRLVQPKAMTLLWL